MKWLLLAAAGLTAGAVPTPDPAAEDRERLQGSWWLASIEREGRQAPGEVLGEADPWYFRGDQVVVDPAARGGTATYRLDPTRQPKAIDLAAPDGSRMVGIYAIEGDALKLCLAYPGRTERPTEFDGRLGSGQINYLFKRQRPPPVR